MADVQDPNPCQPQRVLCSWRCVLWMETAYAITAEFEQHHAILYHISRLAPIRDTKRNRVLLHLSHGVPVVLLRRSHRRTQRRQLAKMECCCLYAWHNPISLNYNEDEDHKSSQNVSLAKLQAAPHRMFSISSLLHHMARLE